MVSQIIGPQLIKTQTIKRHYPELWLGLIIWSVELNPREPHQRVDSRADLDNSYCIVIILAVCLYFVLRRENSKRTATDLNEDERDRLAFLDLTDRKNPYFRYVL